MKLQGCCMVCRTVWEKELGHVNRAIRDGYNVFCSIKCSSQLRKKSISQKKAVKAAYDKKIAQTEERKAAKKIYFAKDYAANPEKYKKERQRRYQAHLQYLNTPEYRAWKKEYDEKYHAFNNYGEFGEAWIFLKQLEGLLDKQALRIDKDCHNKKRKRQKLCKNKSSLPPLPR